MTDFAELPQANVQWDQTEESLSSWLRYNVYRREQGESDWERIAVISDPSITSYADTTVASGVAYEFAVTQTIQVGPDAVESDFPTAAVIEGSFVSGFLHDVSQPAYYVEIPADALSHAIGQDAGYAQVWSRRAPTAHIGPRLSDAVDISMTDIWEDNPEAWRMLRTLMERQAEQGSTLMLRHPQDIRMFCKLENPNKSSANVMYTASMRAVETHYEEVV